MPGNAEQRCYSLNGILSLPCRRKEDKHWVRQQKGTAYQNAYETSLGYRKPPHRGAVVELQEPP
jgi:hypothetical protein